MFGTGERTTRSTTQLHQKHSCVGFSRCLGHYGSLQAVTGPSTRGVNVKMTMDGVRTHAGTRITKVPQNLHSDPYSACRPSTRPYTNARTVGDTNARQGEATVLCNQAHNNPLYCTTPDIYNARCTTGNSPSGWETRQGHIHVAKRQGPMQRPISIYGEMLAQGFLRLPNPFFESILCGPVVFGARSPRGACLVT